MKRWLLAVAVALVLFGGLWLGLAAVHWKGTAEQLGLAAVPLVISLAVLGPWAEQARKPKEPRPVGQEYRDALLAGATLHAGQSLYSKDRSYRLDMQEDGNLVIRKVGGRGASWASKTAQTGENNYLKMQEDGNLVVYTGEHRPVWQSKTAGTGNCAVIQNDGNLVVYTPGGQHVWASHTDLVMGQLYSLSNFLFRRRKPSPKE